MKASGKRKVRINWRDLESLVRTAFEEGFAAGHNAGLSCGHDLSPPCTCWDGTEPEERWCWSEAHDDVAMWG